MDPKEKTVGSGILSLLVRLELQRTLKLIQHTFGAVMICCLRVSVCGKKIPAMGAKMLCVVTCVYTPMHLHWTLILRVVLLRLNT